MQINSFAIETKININNKSHEKDYSNNSRNCTIIVF